MTYYEDDFHTRLAAAKKRLDGPPDRTTRKTPGGNLKAPSRVRRQLRDQNDATASSRIGSLALGAFDTIMFGYLDETTAYVDTLGCPEASFWH